MGRRNIYFPSIKRKTKVHHGSLLTSVSFSSLRLRSRWCLLHHEHTDTDTCCGCTNVCILLLCSLHSKYIACLSVYCMFGDLLIYYSIEQTHGLKVQCFKDEVISFINSVTRMLVSLAAAAACETTVRICRPSNSRQLSGHRFMNWNFFSLLLLFTQLTTHSIRIWKVARERAAFYALKLTWPAWHA